jgi:hypothetical protein
MTPHLDESDARKLSRAVVTELTAMGAHVGEIGVSLKREGFCFMAAINGRPPVWVRTGQGNFTYRAVAAELLNEALHHVEEFVAPELKIVKN